MPSTYTPKEFGQLIGKATKTLQKWDREGRLKAHRDRLVRFGYDYFEAFCERHHTELIVVNGESLSPEQELVQDLIAIVTVFSARLDGLRPYNNVLKEAALRKEEDQ
jgi:predicted site-specific integrase-resolvase